MLTKRQKELTVKGFKNFTGKDIWIYGSSGALVEIPPEGGIEIDSSSGIASLPMPERGVWYIIPTEMVGSLTAQFFVPIATPKFIGHSFNSLPIYHLMDPWNNKLVMSTR